MPHGENVKGHRFWDQTDVDWSPSWVLSHKGLNLSQPHLPHCNMEMASVSHRVWERVHEMT